jgi:hypothetical protein
MRTKILVLAALAAAILIPAGAVPAGDKGLGPANPVSLYLEDGLVGPGREYRSLALFPVSLDGSRRPFASTTLAAASKEDAVELAETKPAGAPGSIQALGFGAKTALALGGELLIGGRLDRMLIRDGFIAPKQEVRLPAVGVEVPSAKREDRVTFDAPGLMAPPYLRMAAHRGDLRRAVERVLDHYTTVLPKDAPAVSLPAIVKSDRMRFLVSDYTQEFLRFPQDVGGPVVGVVAVVGERIALYESFGEPELFRRYWPMLLGSLAFAAAGHEIRTGVAGQPFLVLPAEGPERFLPDVSAFRRAMAGAKVKTGKAEDLTAWYRFAGRTVTGSASAGPDGIVHLVAFPLRASDDAQFGKQLPPEDEETTTPDVGDLLRREREGRLTEYEKRWLERLRQRRRALGGPGEPDPGGVDGGGQIPGGNRPRPPKPGDLPGGNPAPSPGTRPPGGGGSGSGGGSGGGGGSRDEPVPPPGRR